MILAASGHGDAGSRANSYRLMRLLWEQLGLAAGEVGFVRHAQPFLVHTLGEMRAAALCIGSSFPKRNGKPSTLSSPP